jgi:hypothetical protein
MGYPFKTMKKIWAELNDLEDLAWPNRFLRAFVVNGQRVCIEPVGTMGNGN